MPDIDDRCPISAIGVASYNPTNTCVTGRRAFRCTISAIGCPISAIGVASYNPTNTCVTGRRAFRCLISAIDVR